MSPFALGLGFALVGSPGGGAGGGGGDPGSGDDDVECLPLPVFIDDGAPGAGVVRDLALNDCGDLYLDAHGDIAVTFGRSAILSDICARLRTWKGEYFLDTSKGFIDRDKVFARGPDLEILRSLAISEILDVEGVLEVPELTMTVDSRRVLSMDIKVSTDVGELNATVEV